MRVYFLCIEYFMTMIAAMAGDRVSSSEAGRQSESTGVES
jgi:hypothetical protein